MTKEDAADMGKTRRATGLLASTASRAEPPRWRRRATGAGAAAALVVALGTGLAACTRASLPISPPVGLQNCFEDLPLAEGALNAAQGSYEFHGVKLVSPEVMAKLVRRRFPKDRAAAYQALPKGPKVCAFAFTGEFSAGQVVDAPPEASGKAAVVLATTDRHILFSFVLAKLPENFGRPFTEP